MFISAPMSFFKSSDDVSIAILLILPGADFLSSPISFSRLIVFLWGIKYFEINCFPLLPNWLKINEKSNKKFINKNAKIISSIKFLKD